MNLHDKFEEILARRNRVSETLERLKGRKEQAEEALRQVEEECRAKSIDPNQIDEVIRQLELKYAGLINELEQETKKAEEALGPFLKG